jgi:glyoxylate/hydroxypyruvate reductase A
MSKLPAGAYIINVARGAHIAEPDLLTLIKSGHIAAATLDVFRNEPLPRSIRSGRSRASPSRRISRR